MGFTEGSELIILFVNLTNNEGMVDLYYLCVWGGGGGGWACDTGLDLEN